MSAPGDATKVSAAEALVTRSAPSPSVASSGREVVSVSVSSPSPRSAVTAEMPAHESPAPATVHPVPAASGAPASVTAPPDAIVNRLLSPGAATTTSVDPATLTVAAWAAGAPSRTAARVRMARRIPFEFGSEPRVCRGRTATVGPFVHSYVPSGRTRVLLGARAGGPKAAARGRRGESPSGDGVALSLSASPSAHLGGKERRKGVASVEIGRAHV